jgi:hypothetical protein
MQQKLIGSKKLISCITFFLVFLFTIHVVIKASYAHAHLLSDGRLVSHAHPFNRSNDTNPYKSHNHSSAQLFYLENLEVFFPIFFLSIAVHQLNKFVYLPISQYSPIQSQYFSIHLGRAPPVLV